jgi:hypothetical protein
MGKGIKEDCNAGPALTKYATNLRVRDLKMMDREFSFFAPLFLKYVIL